MTEPLDYGISEVNSEGTERCAYGMVEDSTFGSGTLDIRARFFGVKSIEITRIELRPTKYDYGARDYTRDVNRRVYPE